MVPIVQSKKIKLLQMLTNFHIGGTERQVANLALGIDPSHFDLHLACLRHSGWPQGDRGRRQPQPRRIPCCVERRRLAVQIRQRLQEAHSGQGVGVMDVNNERAA